MHLQGELYQLVVFILYPLWLAAGGVDYFCHRYAGIERTSGVRESWLHVLQYLCIAVCVVAAALFKLSAAPLWIAATAVGLHTALSYVDVRYTIPRRHISALEQHVHAVLIVVPIVAVLLLAMADAAEPMLHGQMQARALQPWRLTALIGGAVVGAGAPVIEELVRTLRSANSGEMSSLRRKQQ